MACVILFKTELEKGCNYKLTLVPFEMSNSFDLGIKGDFAVIENI
jgi:hypothetical protein